MQDNGSAAPARYRLRMPRLVVPHLEVAPSLRAVARLPGWDDHPVYAGVGELDDIEIGGWVEGLVADTREGSSHRPAGFVPSTNLWWIDGRTYLGRIQIRHRLTPHLREVGGHIGYYVVTSARRRGHATAMLAATLPVAADLGLECVLLTCDTDNVASRRTIEANGGLYQDQRGDKLRYWVPTNASQAVGSQTAS